MGKWRGKYRDKKGNEFNAGFSTKRDGTGWALTKGKHEHTTLRVDASGNITNLHTTWNKKKKK